jgi:hypothetical protein
MKNKAVGAEVVTLEGKRMNKRDKRNRKMVKRIDKCITRIEKQVTLLLQVSQKLQTIRGIYTDEKKAA